MLALIFDFYLVAKSCHCMSSGCPKVQSMFPINLLIVITSLHRLKYVSQALQSHCAFF